MTLEAFGQVGPKKPPTPKGYFQDRAICPEIMASLVIVDAKTWKDAKNISKTDVEWFVRHTETWLRWFHANSVVWREKLERESSDDRDFVLMFVCHWARAFIMDPQAYKERHPIAILEGNIP